MQTEKTCAFTGHREINEKLDLEYLRLVMQAFIDEGYDTFLSGMAMGFDLIAAEMMLNLKQINPHIKIIACVPCPDQKRYYPEDEKKKYEKVIAECDEVITLTDHYYSGCMQARDRFMVDNCSLLVAYERKNKGGTHYTVGYAKEKDKKIYIV